MSYKKKKLQKSKFNQFKYRFGQIKLAFLKKARILLQKEGRVRVPQTVALLEFLRRQNKIVRSNNQKINEWVDDYMDECKKNGEPVNILTQWCVSKDLEKRYREQNNKFIPTKKERKLFEIEIPRILEMFAKNGFVVNWWVTFNRSYLDSGRISNQLEGEYKDVILQLIQDRRLTEDIILFDWEDDILGAKAKPDLGVLQNVEKYISRGAYNLELARHSTWARQEAGLVQTDKELDADVRFQIACEVNEGRLLVEVESPFNRGRFILVPLEVAERYDNFCVKAPDFKKRIVSVISSYPWRL